MKLYAIFLLQGIFEKVIWMIYHARHPETFLHFSFMAYFFLDKKIAYTFMINQLILRYWKGA